MTEKKDKKEDKKDPPEQKTVKLTIFCDPVLRQRFKLACLLNQETMNDTVTNFMKDYISKNPLS